MRESTTRWIADTDLRHAIEVYRTPDTLVDVEYTRERSRDLYITLVGGLFDTLRSPQADPQELAGLGRALASLSPDLPEAGTQQDCLFFAAVCLYLGGHPASAMLTMRSASVRDGTPDDDRQSRELLARPTGEPSPTMTALLAAVERGDLAYISRTVATAREHVDEVANAGPDVWIAARMRAELLTHFEHTNLRAVLPDGSSEKWTPLVRSMLKRPTPAWDFFPSQIRAIEAGLLESQESYALQMPTGSGKTALTETLLFGHTIDDPSRVAVVLVPYRALAFELRESMGRNLRRMGIANRAVFGGTVPTASERGALDEMRVVIATPEALSGLLGAEPAWASRISLVVVDEGHLLDARGRGVGLELLLARLCAHEPRPRTVFMSAIVPNIQEINAWLGGSVDTAISSDYAPSVAEFAILRPRGTNRDTHIDLELHSAVPGTNGPRLTDFLSQRDFAYLSRDSGRNRTRGFTSKRAQAVAAARKSLPLGPVAVFGAMKLGASGIVGLASELLGQLDDGIALPDPRDFIKHPHAVAEVVAYFASEFGAEWVGTRALAVGAALHHGDIPQETREVVEQLVRQRSVCLVFCTSTLAEGVNLPIRTLVLYSVTRRSGSQQSEAMLARDIKNLVGRAGRAGSATRATVICANEREWDLIRPVALGQAGEPVDGALLSLLRRLEGAIRGRGALLTNDILEGTPAVFELVDGVDATLLEAIHEELGVDRFRAWATDLAQSTFAARKASRVEIAVLERVFVLRAERLLALEHSGRLGLARATGSRPRMLDPILDGLLPSIEPWFGFEGAADGQLVDTVLDWALALPGMDSALVRALPEKYKHPPADAVRGAVKGWLAGSPFVAIAQQVDLSVDHLLKFHAGVVQYELLTAIEQALAVVASWTTESGLSPGQALVLMPAQLRYGVPTLDALSLASRGLRHRRAAVEIAAHLTVAPFSVADLPGSVIADALEASGPEWEDRLGLLTYRRTLVDLRSWD